MHAESHKAASNRCEKRVPDLHDHAKVPLTSTRRNKTSALALGLLLAMTSQLHVSSAPEALAQALRNSHASAVVLDDAATPPKPPVGSLHHWQQSDRCDR